MFQFPAMPEIFLLSAIGVVLLIGLFVKRSRLIYIASQLALLGTFLINLQIPHIPEQIIFNGGFISDSISWLLNSTILILSFFIFIFSREYIIKHQIPPLEFYLLNLFVVLGTLVLISAHNLLILFLGLEFASLPLYALIALKRADSVCAEIALKYFVLGAIASAVFLYGLSIFYGLTHSLSLTVIAQTIQQASLGEQLSLILGLIFTLSGIAFKLGMAPFHSWIPDVYQGAPVSVSLLISSVSKIAGLAIAIRFLLGAVLSLSVQWHFLLVVMAVLSIALGNFIAIVQTSVKRMLGYSAIAQIGYLILGFIAQTNSGYSASLFYGLTYAVSALVAFGALTCLSQSGIEVDDLADLKGLHHQHPWIAFMLLLVMFSLAGIPPLVGFFAKLGVLEALINTHQVWLAVFALVFAVISSYYYLNVVKALYFQEAEQQLNFPSLSLQSKAALTISGLSILVLGLLPNALIQSCQSVFLSL